MIWAQSGFETFVHKFQKDPLTQNCPDDQSYSSRSLCIGLFKVDLDGSLSLIPRAQLSDYKKTTKTTFIGDGRLRVELQFVCLALHGNGRRRAALLPRVAHAAGY